MTILIYSKHKLESIQDIKAKITSKEKDWDKLVKYFINEKSLINN